MDAVEIEIPMNGEHHSGGLFGGAAWHRGGGMACIPLEKWKQKKGISFSKF
jgi:hypothetical protein